MSKENLIVVCFEKVSNSPTWLVLSVEEKGFVFVEPADSKEMADILKNAIATIGTKEYNRRLKRVDISKKLWMKNALRGETNVPIIELLETNICGDLMLD